ncbi:MAG: hypothetical protein R3D98_11310 [Candidatus Krumholzibacteriia bacterium]
MHERDDMNLDETMMDEGAIDLDLPQPYRPLWPWNNRVSGTYTSQSTIILRNPPVVPQPIPIPIPQPRPSARQGGRDATMMDDLDPMPLDDDIVDTGVDELSLIPLFSSETVRLDVDGTDPQQVISGEIRRGLRQRLHWIANLRRRSTSTWTGRVWYRNGTGSLLPQTTVTVRAYRSFFPHQRRLRVTFSGGGALTRTRDFRFHSSYFHDVEFEFDHEDGIAPVTTIQTHAHPNHPATVPSQNLSIETVYRRSGFRVTRSAGENAVPSSLSLGNGDPRWDDNEMHDAMQTYWSRFANTAQWALWVFFAKQHIQGHSLGGIMYDDIGPNHRQGTAIFYDSFISDLPAGDPNPAASVARLKFWTAVHETGHGFNLAHSWQKDHPFGPSWIPLTNDDAALSFMNYPFRYPGGEGPFFANFEYRFTNQELLFLRHAPERFVEPGNADWFQNHGFDNAATEAAPRFRLHLRLNRDTNVCQFLEPVRVEFKLENVSSTAQTIDAGILDTKEHLTICTMRQGDRARQVYPLAQVCPRPRMMLLEPGQSIYATHDVSFGRDGWTITDQGRYVVQACLDLGDLDVVSNPLMLTVLPANNREEMVLAQDIFSTDMARVLTFGGSRVLEAPMDTLRQVADQLRGNPLALHANLCLGRIAMRNYKLLDLKDTTHTDIKSVTDRAVGKKSVKVVDADIEAARKHLDLALTADMARSADLLANVSLHEEIDRTSIWLAEIGDNKGAVALQDQLGKLLKTRIETKTVQTRVLAEIDGMKDALKGGKTRAARN